MFATLNHLSCPLFIPHLTRVHFSFIQAARCPAFRRFLLSQTEHWAQFRSTGLLSTFSSHHLPRHCCCLTSSSPPSPSLSPLFSFFPLSSRSSLPFPFPLSFSFTVVVDWVSECLWQLCVVCNRAERLVWIQRWENLFMWEMHRWRQVSRRCGLSFAVILHSDPDRRSEMAKYARRSAQIPKLHPTIQPMCVSVYSDLTEWFCMWMCVYVFWGWHAWSDSPATCSVQSPLPLGNQGEEVYQLFSFYTIPVISFSFSDMLTLLTGVRIQHPLLHWDVCPTQTAYLVFSFPSLWNSSHICIWMFAAVCPS